MKFTENYTVAHECCDPREPEYKNDMHVSFVSYCEYKKLSVRYRIYGQRDVGQNSVNWFLEEPINLREHLGNEFHRREEIAHRTIKYLKENDFKSSRPYADFSNIQVDRQQVRSLLQHAIHRIRVIFKRYDRHLPSPTVLIVIFFCWLQLQLLPMIGQRIVGIHKAYAIMTFLAILSDIRKDYRVSELITLLTMQRSKRSNKVKRRLKTIKWIFYLHKIKYAISICFVLYFWLYG
jgi:hypothetical protein